MGAPELGQDPRFTPRPNRVANYVALRAELQARFERQPRAHWLERLTAEDVPHAPVLSIGEVAGDAQVRHLGALMDTPLPGGGSVRSVAPPWRVDGSRPAPGRPAPTLGAHTAEAVA